MENDYLTTKQVAKMLNLNVQTVRKYVREGRLQGYYVNKHTVRIKASELEKFVKDKSKYTEETYYIKPGEIVIK